MSYISQKNNMSANNQYTFKYYGFIPSLKDSDWDKFTTNALTLEDAWSKVRRMKFFLKAEQVILDCINGKKVEESLRTMPAVEQTTTHEMSNLPE